MPSRRRQRLNRVTNEIPEDLYGMLQEMREKQVNHIKTTILTMEQRYAHYIASLLDVKKRVCMQLYSNMMDQVLQITNKQTTIMNNYYQQEVTQLRKEKQDLICKNQKHQKLIQHYQTQEIKQKRNKHKHTDTPSRILHPFCSASDTDTLMNASFITDGDAPSGNPFGPCNAHDNDASNPFETMPKFVTDTPSNTKSATISSLTQTALPSEDDASISSIASDTDSNTDRKNKIKRDRKRKKKRRKKKKRKKQKYKYKYRKNKDKLFVAPARVGDTDKTWLWCNHPRAGTDGVCGVNFIRTLKDRDNQCQHYCDGDEQQKLMTRKFGSMFKKCTYCDGTAPCTRLANIDEIEAYQKRLIDMNMVPNTYGGYKVMGAKQTKSQLPTPGSGRRRRSKRKRRVKSETKKERRAVSVGFEAMLPRLNNTDDGAKSDERSRGTTVWDIDDDDERTVSDINIHNKPLRRRSRKRKREEFEEDDSEISDNEGRKKQKLDREELNKLDLDELLSKAFVCKENLEWDIEGEWCRYCGARGSAEFLASLWGLKTLCHKHGTAYKNNELDLSNIVEPTDREHVIKHDACTERIYLINLIVTQHPSVSSYHGVNGRRRSLRNMKKEKMRFVVDSSSSSSESDGSYVDSSGDSDVGNEDEDEDEPIANRMNRMRDINGHNDGNVVNEEPNDADQSHDEDDDILGVD